MTPRAFATLERLIELQRRRAASSLGQIHRDLAANAARAVSARADANPPAPVPGPVDPGHYLSLALLDRWEGARQTRLAAEREHLLQSLPEAAERMRRAHASAQAMELLAARIARAEHIRRARREDLAAAADAANRPS